MGGGWPGQLPVHGTTQTQHSRPMTLRHHTPGVPPTEDTSAGAATFKMACAYTCVCEEEPRRSQEEPRSSQEQPRSSQEQPKSSPGEAQRQPSTYFWPEGGGPKSEEASFGINFHQKSGPAIHRDLLKKCFFEQFLRHSGPPPRRLPSTCFWPEGGAQK